MRAHVTELQDKSKAQAEQIDELHKQMAELKMQAGGKPTVAPVLAKDGTDITKLVALVRDGTDAQKKNAAAALWNLAVNDDNEIAIAKAGGIPPLVALIRDGNDAQKHFAAGALRILAENDDNRIAIAKAKREAGVYDSDSDFCVKLFEKLFV